MKVSTKLPVFMAGIALLCSAGVGIASYVSGADSIRSMAQEHLMALAESRRDTLTEYFATTQRNLAAHAQSRALLAAFSDFDSAWAKYGDKATPLLTKTYIDDNPHPPGERDQLVKAGRKPYDRVHAKHHSVLKDFADSLSLPDLMLVNGNGDLIYTVRKNKDFTANVMSGEQVPSSVANAFRTAGTVEPGSLVVYDQQPYPARGGLPTGLMAAPVSVGSKVIGVAMYQAPFGKVSDLIGTHSGLGKTGEAFLVTGTGLIANDSYRTADVSEVMSGMLNRPEVMSTIGGDAYFGQLADFQGRDVFGAVVPFSAFGNDYAIVVVQDVDEVLHPLTSLRNWTVGIAVICALAAGGLGFAVSRTLSLRITRLSGEMARLAAGDTSIDVATSAGNDEISEMAETVLVFRENALARESLEAEQKTASEQKEQRSTEVARLIDTFRADVAAMLEDMGANTSHMSGAAETLSSIADETAGEARQVSMSSEEASGSVQTVASASEELSASIHEITRQLAKTTEIVQNAVAAADETNVKIEGLAEAAQRIGDVVNLISAIAEQTNLLALNATIEAARAGEAGKGFAVVASEVKELATQTAKATEEIATQISDVQAATKGAVAAIAGITKTMGDVDSYTGSIATAVEQQGMATGEISSSVQEAASGTQNVAHTMVSISDKVQETSSSAGRMLEATSQVSQKTEDLRRTVDRFLDAVAAA